MKKLILSMFVAASVASCSNEHPDSIPFDSISVDSNTLATNTDFKWNYVENKDKMTSKRTFMAMVNAKELLEFKFPYNGGSVATLTVRKKDGEHNIYLSVTKGQFNSDSDGGTIRARFDKEQPKTFGTNEPSDNRNTMIFINNEKSFIAKLKNHKHLIIEAEFYEDGLRQIEFDVSDFKWNH